VTAPYLPIGPLLDKDGRVSCILRATVTPFHAQVLVTTSPDAEHPQWTSGDEAAVASATAIAVATEPDIDGDNQNRVVVEVLVDESPSEGTEVFTGSLLVSSWGVALGDTVSTERHRAALPAGEYGVTIHVEPTANPGRIWVVLTSA